MNHVAKRRTSLPSPLLDPLPDLNLTARPKNYALTEEHEDEKLVAREMGVKSCDIEMSIYDRAARGELDDDYIRSLVLAAA